MTIRSKHNNLMNYFICNNKDLSKEYVKKSEKFLKEISDKQKRNTLKYPKDFEVINNELRVKQ
jgi:hypothetical protein|tara:strand:- start:521 stop:709 length:189 start_codon:yes stop_codon:yes gene_type:complete